MMVGKKLKEVREIRKISQRKLAEKLGVSRTSIARYEQGKTIPNDVVLREICVALNVSVDLLSGGNVAENSEIHDTKIDSEKRAEIKEGLIEQLEEQGILGAHFFDLIDDYMAFWDIKNELLQDIKTRGAVVPWENSKTQKGYKRNDSVAEAQKTNTQMLRILQQLNIKTTEEDGDPDEDDF
jgi:transcriptional regulator with XRE-family HTH domain